MASLTFSPPIAYKHVRSKSHSIKPKIYKFLNPTNNPTVINCGIKLLPVLCTKFISWESSINDENTIIKHSNVVEPFDAEESPQLSTIQNEEPIFEMKNKQTIEHQPLKWPMWLFGPSLLLVTGIIPTLWLPLSSVFVGPNIAGLLSLVGLDCIFNMGATLFILMADSCARPKGGKDNAEEGSRVPLLYRIWNLVACLVGFVVPLLMFFASRRGRVSLELPFISFAVLLGPYLLLVSTQVLTEILTWHWKSPVWLLTPIVYEGYRVLQLMRGIQLGVEIGAPGWVIECIRGLVSWWILVLGIQLMRVGWFAGSHLRQPKH